MSILAAKYVTMPKRDYDYINKLTEYFLNNKKKFWSDDPKDVEVRTWLQQHYPRFIQYAYDNTPEDIRKTISPQKLGREFQKNAYMEDFDKRRQEGSNLALATIGRGVLAGAAAPLFGPLATAWSVGEAALAVGNLAGMTAGAKIGDTVGKRIDESLKKNGFDTSDSLWGQMTNIDGEGSIGPFEVLGGFVGGGLGHRGANAAVNATGRALASRDIDIPWLTDAEYSGLRQNAFDRRYSKISAVADSPAEANILPYSSIVSSTERSTAPVESFYSTVKPRLDDVFFKNGTQVSLDEIPKLSVEPKTSDIFRLRDMAETQRNRDWLKGFNASFVRRYHYDPIPLNLSKDTHAAEAAVKDLLHRHNRVVRGVDDFMNEKSSLRPFEKDFLRKLMRLNGYDPDSREDRLLFATTTYAPMMGGYGRAGLDLNGLYRIASNRNVARGYTNSLQGEFDFFDPQNIGLRPTARGSHYASNSIGTGAGYTYNTGKIGLIEYPFELGPDRNLWQFEADFPTREYELPYRYLVNSARNMAGQKPLVPGNLLEPLVWLDDVRPSKMTAKDIRRLLEYSTPVGKQDDFPVLDSPGTISPVRPFSYNNRSYYSSGMLGLIKDYLEGKTDILGAMVSPERQVYDFDGNPYIEEAVLPYVAPKRFREKPFAFFTNLFGYIDNPKTVADYVHNSSIIDALSSVRGSKDLFQKGSASKLSGIISKSKTHNYNTLLGKNRKDVLAEIQHNNKKFFQDEYNKMIRSSDPYLSKINEALPKTIHKRDATRKNSKKSDSAFSHFISTGPIGEKAVNFVEWINPKDYSLDEIGAVTRQHYGVGSKDLTRNTKASGGKIYIKPSKKGTFTAAAKKNGKSVQAFASQVLAHKENYSPAMVKKANFARNASRWHADGGLLNTFDLGGNTQDAILYDYFRNNDSPLADTLLIQPQSANTPAYAVKTSGDAPDPVYMPVVENPVVPQEPVLNPMEVTNRLKQAAAYAAATKIFQNTVPREVVNTYIRPQENTAEPEYAPSEDLIQSLIGYEGFLERPSRKIDGKWTIGYGDTDKALNDYYLKNPNKKYNKTEAEKRLRDRVTNEFLPELKKSVPNWERLTPQQKDSLLSYAYNVGKYFTSTHKNFVSAMKDFDIVRAAKELNAGWNQRDKSTGKLLYGLRKRRIREQRAFLGDKFSVGGVIDRLKKTYSGDARAMLEAVRKARSETYEQM